LDKDLQRNSIAISTLIAPAVKKHGGQKRKSGIQHKNSRERRISNRKINAEREQKE